MSKAEKLKVVDSEILLEFGYRTQDTDGKIWIAVKPFYLNDLGGPWKPVKVGQRLMLSPKTALDAFHCKKIEPETLGEIFTVTRPFRTAHDEQWIYAEVGDTVRLGRAEAIEFLRKGLVKEKPMEKGEQTNEI